MSDEGSSFLSRWSRRKLEVQREQAAAKPAAPLPAEPVVPAATAAAVAAPAPVAEPAVELPSLESLDGLRSDYSAFMGEKVSEDTKRSALKKLFGDPHFNQMDGLDIYIGDYTHFEPLPDAMRLVLNSAQEFLLDSEKASIAPATAALPPAAPEPLADSSRIARESEVPVEIPATVASGETTAASSESQTTAVAGHPPLPASTSL
ncbi:MAG: DUF3306 domain-containing protein [Burkholderiaceae bacterium]